MKMPSYSLYVNGVWERLPKGIWVEIENGLGDFAGARGTITHGPYGYGPRGDGINSDRIESLRSTDRNFPPMYNILVTKPHREKAIEVNFEAHKLRKLTPVEIKAEKLIRSKLLPEEQTNRFTIVDGKRIPNPYPAL